MGVYVHKICEDNFGGYHKSFSWLGEKVNKKIDAYGTMPTQRLSKISPHGSEFEAIEYSYSIRNFKDIQFE